MKTSEPQSATQAFLNEGVQRAEGNPALIRGVSGAGRANICASSAGAGGGGAAITSVVRKGPDLR